MNRRNVALWITAVATTVIAVVLVVALIIVPLIREQEARNERIGQCAAEWVLKNVSIEEAIGYCRALEDSR